MLGPDQIAKHTGLVYRGEEGALPLFVHEVTAQEFVQVPAGAYLRGMSTRELLEAIIRFGPTDAVRRVYAGASSVESVQVPTFLCGRSPLLGSTLSRLGLQWSTHETADERLASTAAALTPDIAARVTKYFRWRLISDAQWEYVARCGGGDSWAGGKRFAEAVDSLVFEPHFDGRSHLNDWDIWGLSLGEWVADEPSPPHEYRGGGVLHAPWQDAVEALSCHAAARPRSGEWRGVFCARPTIALPFATVPKAMERPKALTFDEVHQLYLRLQKDAHERAMESKTSAQASALGTIRSVGGDGVYIVRFNDRNGVLRLDPDPSLDEGDSVRVRVVKDGRVAELALEDA